MRSPFSNLPALARTTVFTLATAALCTAHAAVDIKGAKFEDTYQLANQSLSLNGAGVRVKVVFDVYAAGLYVPRKGHEANAVLSQPGAKSLQIVLLRDLTGEDFAEAMAKGFAQTNPAAEQTRFQPRLDELRRVMVDIGKARKGAVIHLNFTPGTGTSVVLNGARRGSDIPGDDFFPALMRIWLGNPPVDSDLKNALLDSK